MGQSTHRRGQHPYAPWPVASCESEAMPAYLFLLSRLRRWRPEEADHRFPRGLDGHPAPTPWCALQNSLTDRGVGREEDLREQPREMQPRNHLEPFGCSQGCSLVILSTKVGQKPVTSSWKTPKLSNLSQLPKRKLSFLKGWGGLAAGGMGWQARLHQLLPNRLEPVPPARWGALGGSSADAAKRPARLESKCACTFALIVDLFSPCFSFNHFVTHSLRCGINDTSKLKRHSVHRGDSSGSRWDGPGPLSSSLSHLQGKPLLAIRASVIGMGFPKNRN